MTEPTERWLPIPGYEGFYEASDLGRVRSVRRMTACGWRGGRLLKPFPDSDGYLRVNLSRQGVIAGLRPVHGLVLLAFIGPVPPGQQVRHGPGGKRDNCLANLCYGTPLEQSDDKRRDGTIARGERQGSVRFTEADVKEMRRQYAVGVSRAEIARQYRTSHIVVTRIINGEAWNHVSGAMPLRPSTGSAHHSAKLTEAIVAECRRRHAAGETQRALAREFEISRSVMSSAIRRKTWHHVS